MITQLFSQTGRTVKYSHVFLSLAKFQKSEGATVSLLWKKYAPKISQNLEENTCARVSFLIKLQT